jgi:thiosulfate/3-mercaptopyruvate sulfurtransferase
VERDLSTAFREDHDPARGGRHPLPPLREFCATVGAWGIGPGTRVAVYDATGGANAAARAWWMLRSLGVERVQVLDGGLQAALDAGLHLTTEVPVFVDKEPYPAARWHSTVVEIGIVEQLARHKDWKVLDVRSAERYRGETEPFDPVAGHIPGALNRPYTENLGPDGRFKSREELRALYADLMEGLRPDHLVVHCGSGVTACHTLLALEAAGYRGPEGEAPALYVGSWSEWCRSGREQGKGGE